MEIRPRIRTWKTREPATASQFQSPFKVNAVIKVKAKTATAVIVATAGAATDSGDRVVQTHRVVLRPQSHLGTV